MSKRVERINQLVRAISEALISTPITQLSRSFLTNLLKEYENLKKTLADVPENERKTKVNPIKDKAEKSDQPEEKVTVDQLSEQLQGLTAVANSLMSETPAEKEKEEEEGGLESKKEREVKIKEPERVPVPNLPRTSTDFEKKQLKNDLSWKKVD